MTYHFNIGDPVVVLDAKGEERCRGAITMKFAAGQYAPGENLYAVMPRGALSLSQVVHNVREDRLRGLSKPVLAFVRKPGVERGLP